MNSRFYYNDGETTIAFETPNEWAKEYIKNNTISSSVEEFKKNYTSDDTEIMYAAAILAEVIIDVEQDCNGYFKDEICFNCENGWLPECPTCKSENERGVLCNSKDLLIQERLQY